MTLVGLEPASLFRRTPRQSQFNDLVASFREMWRGAEWTGNTLGTVSSHTLAGASTICLCGGSHYLLLPHQLTNGRLEAAVNGL